MRLGSLLPLRTALRSTSRTMAAKRQKSSVPELSLATWEQAARQSDVLNLGIGQPNRNLLPSEAIQRAASTLNKYDPFHVLQYGSIAGATHYLDALASFLGQQPLDHKPSSTNLFATPGNSGGLALVARTLTSPGDRVLMEDPSYFLAHQILRDYHLELIRLPQRTDHARTRVRALPRALLLCGHSPLRLPSRLCLGRRRRRGPLDPG